MVWSWYEAGMNGPVYYTYMLKVFHDLYLLTFDIFIKTDNLK